MSDGFDFTQRARGRTLMIVEGKHEKNELFWALFKCFPELAIAQRDVWIYGTNIYCLYDSIVNEYGSDWEDTDINLPLLISRGRSDMPVQDKNDFKNIILVFDYERHDPKFSEAKIQKLQAYFSDVADVGKLYINYPMIESYQDLRSLPDPSYETRRVSVTLRPGARYKSSLGASFIAGSLRLPGKLKKHLIDKCRCQELIARQLTENILLLPRSSRLSEEISAAIDGQLPEIPPESSKRYICHLINSLSPMPDAFCYWQYLRRMFQHIIKDNIRKCSKILGSAYALDDLACKDFLSDLNFLDILVRQNALSRDPVRGEIWVVNTCILLIAEYNYALLLAAN